MELRRTFTAGNILKTAKRIWLHGKTVVAYEIGDLLTDNAYRGMGLFSQLIELVCSEARDHGSCLVYARPNRIALPILAGKLHFQEAQRIDTRRWVIPSRVLSRETGIPASLLRLSGLDWLLKSRIPRWSGDVVTAVPVDRFAEEVDQLWRRASEGFDFALVRDSNYLNWRFCDCPTPYKIWCALRKGKTVGFLVTSADRATPTAAIIDLFTDSGDVEAVRVLLANGMDFMLSNGVQSVRSWTLQGPVQSAAHKLLQRMLPFRRKQSHALVFRVLLPQEITLPVSSKKWHFNLGDTDGA